jgi:hypothetical protein
MDDLKKCTTSKDVNVLMSNYYKNASTDEKAKDLLGFWAHTTQSGKLTPYDDGAALLKAFII